MKLQGFTIIFALVAIPLILVLTYYIQLQVNTITLQNEYDSKLLDATYDAMSSFEINTANEDLSTVSDSLRTIIEASNNVFFNTLATNLGLSNASKSYVDPYIPAILYTMYDGYYISAPTQVPEILTDSDGNAVLVGDVGVTTSDGGENYIYTDPGDIESMTEEQKKNASVSAAGHLNRLNDEHLHDYGQLLYLKDSATNTYTADISKAQLSTKNVLKTYMPYSARYKDDSGNIDITVIYTLDNYVTIEGTIDNVYYTKSGYLLPKDILDGTSSDDLVITSSVNLLSYNQNDAQNYIEQGNDITVAIDDISFSSGTQVTLTDGTVIESCADLENQLNILNNNLNDLYTRLAGVNNGTNTTDNKNDLENQIQNYQSSINTITYTLEEMSAVTYYVKAAIFSNWVYENLSTIEENDLIEISGQNYTSINNTEVVTHDFSTSTRKIFDTQDGDTQEGITEIATDSSFYNHKLAVIRNSIQYNLNLAMSTYNEQTSNSYSYEMPVMQNEEWSRILSNVSIVSFMQGYSCGLKIYNNYMVVSSTNNEINVSPKNIYYVKMEDFSNEASEYHRIDCPDLAEIDYGTSNNYISFSSKEVKYDKLYDKNNSSLPYSYDHKNLACYDCINDGNYDEIDIFSDTDTEEPIDTNVPYLNLRKAYYIAVAKERNDLYKMNAFDNSEGYEIIYNLASTKYPDINKASSLPINKIKTIEIVLGTIKTRNPVENLRYEFSLNGTPINVNDTQPNSITSNQTNLTTLTINLNPDSFAGNTNTFSINILGVTNTLGANSTTYLNSPDEDKTTIPDVEKEIFEKAIRYIRVIYK